MCWYMIYLLRHGEIADATDRRYIGQTDCALSESGRAQAIFWKKWFHGKTITSIYCSDLVRSSETAEIILADRPLEIRIDPLLREINLGDWDGRPMQDIRTEFPVEWKQRGECIDTFRPPKGESFTDLYRRVVPVFEQIADIASPPVLIVGHAGVNRVILCRVLGMPIRNLFAIGQNYGALNIIEKGKAELKVAAMNVGASFYA